ncbi:serine hydroxymethyltransferase [Synechococcus elongatus PCC 6301]|uniref:Serine hydroxymethyltransferase n=1 Tax=Synechococcus sp. (strain ATCC 27144 / PCC 6301 / SAUG 1402/1) TaxID=269084 RepID=A0A0H3K2F3_SYNP6|nr:serine hydroxymethyltransferase [Synechococcus elongatus PCC 6301]
MFLLALQFPTNDGRDRRITLGEEVEVRLSHGQIPWKACGRVRGSGRNKTILSPDMLPESLS